MMSYFSISRGDTAPAHRFHEGIFTKMPTPIQIRILTAENFTTSAGGMKGRVPLCGRRSPRITGTAGKPGGRLESKGGEHVASA